MSDPKHPEVGALIIDASDLTPVDNPKNAVRKYGKVRPGYKKAVQNLLGLSAAMLARAGIDAAQITQLAAASTTYDRCMELLPAVMKLGEVLKETAQFNADIMAKVIEEAVSQTRRRARRDAHPNEVLGALEPTTTYHAEPAIKAVKTKIVEGTLKPKPAAKPRKRRSKKPVPKPPAQTG